MSAPRAAQIPAFVNPLSKRGPDALELLREDPRFELHETPPAHLREAIQRAVARGARRVLVSGGDGSIATAASALGEGATELAVVPGGTLNHFARDHGIPTDLREAADLAATSTHTTLVDLGRVNEFTFVNTSSVGAYVTFVRWRERLEPRWGYLASSLIAGARLLGRMRPLHVVLDVNGQSRRFRTSLVYFGAGERRLQLPSLGALVPDGGRGLHIVLVHGRVRARLIIFGLATTVAGRRMLTSTSHVESMLVERCSIELPRSPASISVDGEIVDVESPLDYELRRDALRVVVPPPG